MLNRYHLISAACLSAASLFAANVMAQNTGVAPGATVTQQRSTTVYHPAGATDTSATVALPAGITAKNLNNDKAIDKAFKKIAEDAITHNGFDNVVGMVADQDQARFKENVGKSSWNNVDGNNNKKLNDLATNINNTFKSKYNHDFDMDYSKVFTPDFVQIMTGEVADPMALVGKWPLDAAPGSLSKTSGKVTPSDAEIARDKAFGGKVNLEKGRNVAIAHIKESHGMPGLTASLIHETASGWKFDVPNTLTAQKLYDNLVANLTVIDNNKSNLPGDINDGYRQVSHAVIAALYDIDLSKGNMAMDNGAVRPSNTTGTVNNR